MSLGLIDFIDIRGYNPTEFGKFMGPVIEGIIKNVVAMNHHSSICPIIGTEDINLNNKQIQIKYRGTILHLEPTRRSNGKNSKSSKSGHPRYKVSEQDYFLICRDTGNFYNSVIILSDNDYKNLMTTGMINGKHFTEFLEFSLMKSKDLEDSKLPDYIVARISAKIWKNRIMISGKDYIEKIADIVKQA